MYFWFVSEFCHFRNDLDIFLNLTDYSFILVPFELQDCNTSCEGSRWEIKYTVNYMHDDVDASCKSIYFLLNACLCDTLHTFECQLHDM